MRCRIALSRQATILNQTIVVITASPAMMASDYPAVQETSRSRLPQITAALAALPFSFAVASASSSRAQGCNDRYDHQQTRFQVTIRGRAAFASEGGRTGAHVLHERAEVERWNFRTARESSFISPWTLKDALRTRSEPRTPGWPCAMRL